MSWKDGADVSGAMQELLDAGVSIELPSGTFYAADVTLRAGSSITGPRSAVLVQPPGHSFMLGAILVSSIIISGMTLRAVSGFAEHEHILYMDGASRVVVSDVQFEGFRGDGVYIGSSSEARHNSDIYIKACRFDGVDYQNRNAISVIDGTRVAVESCFFQRCSLDTMPGAIDIEPDHSFNRLSGISISRCTFSKIRGGVGVISMPIQYAQADMLAPMSGLTISGNVFAGQRTPIIFLRQPQKADAKTAPNNVVVSGNQAHGSGGASYYMSGISGVTISNNKVCASLRKSVEIDCFGVVRVGNDIPADNPPIRGVTFCGEDRVSKHYYPGAVGWSLG